MQQRSSAKQKQVLRFRESTELHRSPWSGSHTSSRRFQVGRLPRLARTGFGMTIYCWIEARFFVAEYAPQNDKEKPGAAAPSPVSQPREG